MTMTLSDTSQVFLDRYAELRGRLAGADLPWLAKIREDAANTFRVTGVPTPRMEDWKYTNLKALDALELVFAARPADVGADTLPAKLGDGPRLVFVDGRFRADLSDSLEIGEGIRLASLADMLSADPGFIEPRLAGFGDNAPGAPMLALNGAFQEDGYVIALDANADAGAAIEILFWDTAGEAAAVRQPRNMIVAAANSRAEIIERHMGAGSSRQFFNGATLVTLDAGAAIGHYRVQSQGAGSVHVNTIRTRIEADARYESFILAEGGDVARDEVQVGLMAAGAYARLDGIYLADGAQVLDNTTTTRHAAPNTTCQETYKGALDGTARAVFQGAIRVEPGADGTDAQMSNKTLLLSDDAEIDTKPQLEIYADEVKCAHGATTGELDAEAMFYLRSRGIPEIEARGILVEGFLDEVTEAMGDTPFAHLVRGHVAAWVGRGVKEKEMKG